MTKFVRVYDKNRNVVLLNVENIVVMRQIGSDFNARMKIKDVLGNLYLSLEEPDIFRAKIGVDE